jgi:beta-1,4-mannosyltransferase
MNACFEAHAFLDVGDDLEAGRMRVLSGPSEGFRHPNPYIKMLLKGLSTKVDLEVFRWRTALFGEYDILHLHWPEHLISSRNRTRSWIKALALGAIIVRAKLGAKKLVWTVHNETPHEQHPLSSAVAFWCFQRSADAAIFLTDSGRATYPTANRPGIQVVIRHGHYGPSLPDLQDRRALRAESHRPYLLAFGLLRPYKGLDRLIEAVVGSSNDVDLVIAGQPRDRAHLEQLERIAGADPRIRLDARYIPQPELVSLIEGSLGVVLPYRHMTNSGALMMALTLARPVLVPEGQSNREIAGLVGAEWVDFFTSPLEPQHIDRFVVSAAKPRDVPPDLRAFGWDDIIAAHESLYCKLVDR